MILSWKIIALWIAGIIGSNYCSNNDQRLDSSGNNGGGTLHGVSEPDFDIPIQNVTAPIGKEAALACIVKDIGNYKVGWMRNEDQTILTLHTRVVTHNSRISVNNDDEDTWQLRIRSIRESDRGCYMCQINTIVMKKQLGCIDVQVPPNISDDKTSSDKIVNENENVTLYCKAEGRPAPRILWRREDGGHIIIRNGTRPTSEVELIVGDTLTLLNLERSQLGAYLCIASNDVPPSVSKRIMLHIMFAPFITTSKKMVGAPTGSEVILECEVEAYPMTIVYWMKNNGVLISPGKKFDIIEEKISSYQIKTSLKIKKLRKGDFGIYSCVTTNSVGKADDFIRVYEIKTTTTSTTSTTKQTTITTRPTTTAMTHTSTAIEVVTFQMTEPVNDVREQSVLDSMWFVTGAPHYRAGITSSSGCERNSTGLMHVKLFFVIITMFRIVLI